MARDTTVIEGEVVRVDASLTTDIERDELVYRWTQTGGITIELGENTSPLLSFNAPQVDGDEVLLFKLDVFDGRDISSSNIRVFVRDTNTAPQVSINSHSAAIDENSSLSITASISDSDSDTLRIEWRQISGPTVALTGADTTTVSFTAPAVSSDETIELSAVVTDGLKEVSATTRISILNVNTTSSSGGGSSDGTDSGGGSLNLGLILMGFILACVRRQKYVNKVVRIYTRKDQTCQNASLKSPRGKAKQLA